VLLTTVGLLVEIEIYSDVVCPWCYLGKTRLERALATYPGEVTLRWRAFQLDPDMPHECQPLLGWLGQRFGGEERARQIMGHVTALAAAEGLSLDFDRALIANTFDTDGLDIGSMHTLVEIADQVGLDPDRTHQFLTSNEGTADVRAQIAHAHDVG